MNQAATAMSPSTKTKLNELAQVGVLIGTSSWKYPGWCGQLYEERYLTRSKFSEAKFEANCLEEYAQTFSTVCVDAGHYQFPTEQWLAKLCAPVPPTFRFSFKVTDMITTSITPTCRATAASPANAISTSSTRRCFARHSCARANRSESTSAR